jgi:hypothetical protein
MRPDFLLLVGSGRRSSSGRVGGSGGGLAVMAEHVMFVMVGVGRVCSGGSRFPFGLFALFGRESGLGDESRRRGKDRQGKNS